MAGISPLPLHGRGSCSVFGVVGEGSAVDFAVDGVEAADQAVRVEAVEEACNGVGGQDRSDEGDGDDGQRGDFEVEGGDHGEVEGSSTDVDYLYGRGPVD